MGKIPFGKTIAFAYGLVVSDFLGLLGIVWLPSALLALAGYFAMGPYMQHLPQMFGDNPDPDLMMRNMRFVWLLSVAGWIVSAMLVAGVTAEALGLRRGMKFVYFSLGASVWRVFASYFLAIVAVIVLMILIAIVMAIVGGAGGAIFAASGGGAMTDASRIGGGLLGILLLLCVCLAIYIDVRLFSLIAPVAVAEKKIDLVRAWTLSGGNFWRLFGIWLAILIPFAVATWVIYAFFLGWQFIPPISIAHMMSLHDPAQTQSYFQHQMQAWSIAQANHWKENLLLTVPVGIVISAIWHGLSNGSMAFAYRALVPTETVPNG